MRPAVILEYIWSLKVTHFESARVIGFRIFLATAVPSSFVRLRDAFLSHAVHLVC